MGLRSDRGDLSVYVRVAGSPLDTPEAYVPMRVLSPVLLRVIMRVLPNVRMHVHVTIGRCSRCTTGCRRPACTRPTGRRAAPGSAEGPAPTWALCPGGGRRGPNPGPP